MGTLVDAYTSKSTACGTENKEIHLHSEILFVEHSDSSAYEFNKFVHKIRHVVIQAYYYYRLLVRSNAGDLLYNTQRRRTCEQHKRVDADNKSK